MTAREAASFMRAFGDGTRLRILVALSTRELSVAQMTGLLRCPKTRISRHLGYLRSRSIVESQQMGNSVVYRLLPPQHPLHRWALGALQQCSTDIEDVHRDTMRLGNKAGGSKGMGRRG